MKNSSFVKVFLLISLAALLILPVYTIFFLTPSFTRFLIEDTEKRLVRVATRMADGLLKEEKAITAQSITPYFVRELGHIRAAIDIQKVKVFTIDGEIIFSTDPADIGQKTHKDFFGMIVTTGRPHSYIATKNKTGSNGAVEEVKIIETYVPVIYKEKVVGVFEIYYDITATTKALNKLIDRAYFVLFSIILLLLGTLLFSITKARACMQAQKLADDKISQQKILLEEQNRQLVILHDQAQTLSLQDHLTGLGNRRLLEIHFDRAISLAHRYGKPLSLIMLDVDYFKKFNDTHGHLAGDNVLCQVASVIQSHLREADSAFRYGGEEFLLLLPVTDLKTALVVAEKVRFAVAQATDVTISLGVSSFRKDATFEEVIKEADDALYEAKRLGRNQVVCAKDLN